jgi:hypothetical protein
MDKLNIQNEIAVFDRKDRDDGLIVDNHLFNQGCAQCLTEPISGIKNSSNSRLLTGLTVIYELNKDE